jgi:hypothetical protein
VGAGGGGVGGFLTTMSYFKNFSIVNNANTGLYLKGSRHILDLLVEDFFDPFTHGGDSMIRTVECQRVAEYQPDIGYELLCIIVTRVG